MYYFFSSSKRLGDFLYVHPSGIQLDSNNFKVTFLPNIPQVPMVTVYVQLLQSFFFFPPPLASEEQIRLYTFCVSVTNLHRLH